jgi:CubicO group peptidase (beta-lactamase class C family)
MNDYSRRQFLEFAGFGTMPFLSRSVARIAMGRRDPLDDFIEAQLVTERIPGLAASIVKSGRIVWSKGYGWANIGGRVPMNPDHTVQNIGSISKTVTATAVMQLVEQARLDLDADVGSALPFPVRNPFHPEIPITARLLLTHQSSIADGPAYGDTYGCGDPSASLEAWLPDYLITGGRHYRAADNFHPWKPGERWKYSNIGFGLLGYLVERLSGEPFPRYTRERIFEPLGMRHTGWLLSDVDNRAHAIPYTPADETPPSKELAEYRKYGLLAGEPERDPVRGTYQPLCLYSFTTYPDGALRTSVNELARFLLAYLHGGAFGNARILAPDTVRRMLTSQVAPTRETEQGLGFDAIHSKDGLRWGHNGADPGVRTNMWFRPEDGVGVIVFINRGNRDLARIVDRLFDEANRFG